MISEQNNNQKYENVFSVMEEDYAACYEQLENMTLKELYDSLHSVDREIMYSRWRLESAKAAMLRVNPTSDEFMKNFDIADREYEKISELTRMIRPIIMNHIQREETEQQRIIDNKMENEKRLARCKEEHRASFKELIEMSDNVERMTIDDRYRLSSDEIKVICNHFIGFEEHVKKAFNIGFFRGMDYMSERIVPHDEEGDMS